MLFIPLFLAALLHDIVPGIDGVAVIILENIEGRAGERQKLRIMRSRLFDDFPDNIVAQSSGRAFVRFIHDNQVPVEGENCRIFIKFAANGSGATQILNRCKVNKVLSAGNQLVNIRADIPRAIDVIVASVEYFPEILIPSAVHDRSVRKDNCSGISGFLHDLQGGQGFPEAHFRIPKHSVPGFELLQGFGDCLLLLRTEYDWSKVFAGSPAKTGSSLFYCVYGFQGCLQVNCKPFPAGGTFELLLRNARISKHTVNFIVAERFQENRTVGIFHCANRKLRMQKMRRQTGGVGILPDSRKGSLIQFSAVRRQTVNGAVRIQRCIADFQKSLVRICVDFKGVNHLVAEG